MGVNRATNELGKRIVGEIKYLGREQRAMKQRQLFGGDNIVKEYSDFTTTSLTIGTGQGVVLTITITPVIARLLLLEPEWGIYITNNNDPTYLWPSGSNLSTDQKYKVLASMHRDTFLTDPVTGAAVYLWQIVNNTAAPITVYLGFQFVTDKVETI